MSIDTFKARWPRNVPGTFYVSDQCIDCGACRRLAPGLFAGSEEGRYSYVARQPAGAQEMALADQAAAECPVDAIHADGDRFNWKLIRPRAVPGE